MSTGLFISFEGIDGSGKTTQVQRAHDFLQSKGFSAVVTREPGGTPAGLVIRELLLHGIAAFPSIAMMGSSDVVDASDDFSFRTEALLYAADRAEHVSHFIQPALDQGQIVLCDRYIDSSIAYQASGRQIDEAVVKDVSRWAADGLTPKRTYLLDIDPLQSRARYSDEPDRMEAAGGDFQKRVRAKFLELAEQEPDRFVVIDASQSAKEVWKIIEADLESLTQGMPVNYLADLNDDVGDDSESNDLVDGGSEQDGIAP